MRTRETGTLLSIQVLRAVAALAVVMPHINREFEHKFGLLDVLPLAAFRVGNIGVDLFFVISGFIMVYVSEPLFGRRDAPRRFMLRRLARIVPLYWAVSGLLLVYVLVAYRDLASANMSVGSVIASFAFFPFPRPDGDVQPINGIGWTLNYEMFFYVIFAVALLAARGAAVIGVSVLFVVLAALGYWFSPLPEPFAFWTDPIILEFVFGMWIALAFRTGVRLPPWATYGVVLASLALVVASVLWGLETLPRVIERGVPAAMLVAGVALAGAPRSTALGWRVLGFVGDASYALYLTHPIALTLPRLLFPGLIDPAAHPWLYVAMLLAVAIALASVLHLAFEKPVTQWLQGQIVARGRKRRAAAGPDGDYASGKVRLANSE